MTVNFQVKAGGGRKGHIQGSSQGFIQVNLQLIPVSGSVKDYEVREGVYGHLGVPEVIENGRRPRAEGRPGA